MVADILQGPGLERWPGAPAAPDTRSDTQNDARSIEKPVEGVDKATVFSSRARDSRGVVDHDAALARMIDRRKALRLRLIATVRVAASQLEESEVRQLVEQGIQNAKERSDYN